MNRRHFYSGYYEEEEVPMGSKDIAGKYYEDWELGEEYETAATTVTEAHVWINMYLTGYYSLIHTDIDYAKSTIFGERVAPGFLVHSISTGQVNQTRLFEGTTIAFLGIKYINFVKPVKIGDTIKTVGKLIEKKDSKKPGRGIVVFHARVVNQRGETVTESERIILLRKKIGFENI
jgi:acyl dehydratase